MKHLSTTAISVAVAALVVMELLRNNDARSIPVLKSPAMAQHVKRNGGSFLSEVAHEGATASDGSMTPPTLLPVPPKMSQLLQYEERNCKMLSGRAMQSTYGITCPVAALQGPHPQSNWIVPGVVATGDDPGNNLYSSELSKQTAINSIAAAGINTIVSLLEDPPSYLVEMKQVVATGGALALHWIHFPMPDMSIANDKDTVAFVEELAQLIKTHDRRIYIHCWSGRGRTGTIAIPLLMALYPHLSPTEAQLHVNTYKRLGRTGSTRSGEMPEADDQKEQITRLQYQYNTIQYSAQREE